jgi:hypothetical protein
MATIPSASFEQYGNPAITITPAPTNRPAPQSAPRWRQVRMTIEQGTTSPPGTTPAG